MKKILLVLIGVLVCLGLFAQIELSSTTLPKVGDTLYYKTDRSPQDINVLLKGPNLRWDFRNLKAPFAKSVILKKYEQQNHQNVINGANMLLFEKGEEKYYLHTGREGIEILASYENDFINSSARRLSIYSNPAIFRKANWKYQDKTEKAFSFSISYSFEELPIYFFKDYQILPDSLKVLYSTVVSYEVDAFGQLLLPDQISDVIRIQIITKRKLHYELKMNGIWVAVESTNIMGSRLSDSERTKKEYHFYSDNSKLPLAIVQMDEFENATEVEYQTEYRREKSAVLFSNTKTITAIPNPTFGETRFEFYNYPETNYTIEIYNIIGKRIWKKDYILGNDNIIKENFSFLNKGTYLYSIIDADGNKVTTKRLVLIRP